MHLFLMHHIVQERHQLGCISFQFQARKKRNGVNYFSHKGQAMSKFLLLAIITLYILLATVSTLMKIHIYKVPFPWNLKWGNHYMPLIMLGM